MLKPATRAFPVLAAMVGLAISNRTGHPVEILATVATIYVLIAFPLTRAVTRLEYRVLAKLSV